MTVAQNEPSHLTVAYQNKPSHMTVAQNESSHPTVTGMYLNDTQSTQNCLAPVYHNCTLWKPSLPKTV